MDENDSIQPTPDSGYLQSDSQNGDTGFSQDNDVAVSHDRLIDTAQDNESRQADDSVKSEPDTKSGADDSVKLTADDTDGDTVRKDDTNMEYVTETRDASATDEVSASLEENSKSKKKSKTKEEEFELATVKTDHALGTRENDPIIAPIDLDRRKEEEQRIKMSWTQQLSVSNKVSPADIPDTELSTMDYHPEKAVDISKFGSTVPINGASTYSPVQDQRKMERVIGGDDTSQSGDIGCCGSILMFLSFILVLVTFPISLFFCIKVVQEYERAVIFRVGRLLSGGSKGPGIFFVLPCIEGYTKVDLRTVSFDVPPQEVGIKKYAR
uniref:Stomatin-2 n=1 Tax=Magallana gigas TaxID=29159 RepID=K1PQT3_MAGGI